MRILGYLEQNLFSGSRCATIQVQAEVWANHVDAISVGVGRVVIWDENVQTFRIGIGCDVTESSSITTTSS
jgi:hypothetical protein